jgi:hypothetical protein
MKMIKKQQLWMRRQWWCNVRRVKWQADKLVIVHHSIIFHLCILVAVKKVAFFFFFIIVHVCHFLLVLILSPDSLLSTQLVKRFHL